MPNKNKPQRRSFYFSSKNADLLDFLESQEGLSANEFLIEILRAAQSNTHPKSTKDMTNEELYSKLESLISNLKVVQGDSGSGETEAQTETQTDSVTKESNPIPTFDAGFFDFEL